MLKLSLMMWINKRDSYFNLFGLSSDDYDWRGLYWFLAVYIGAFVLAGIMAPFAYSVVEGLAVGADEESVWAYLSEKGIHRFVDRFRLLGAALSLLWLIGYCKLWGHFGFCGGKKGIQALGLGLGIGFFSLLPIIGLQLLFLPVELKTELTVAIFVETVGVALLGGLIIGFLEESIFRGMVFRMFYSAMRPSLAIAFSCLLFAASHFKKVHWDTSAPVEWYSGLIVAWKSFMSLFYTFSFFPFVNYFLVGLVLTLVFLRSRSLMLCLGIHAGWVLVLNSWSDLMQIGESDRILFLGGIGVINGILPIALLVLMSFAVVFLPRAKDAKPEK